MRTVAAVASALLLTAPAAAGVPAPRIAATIRDVARPLPLPYATGNAEPAIAAARARALADHKRLLVDLGGNWCLNCRLLAGILRLPPVHTFMARHFELVTVDIGRFDRNLAVPMRLGFTGRAMFVPALVVTDPRAHHIVNRGGEMALATPGALTPQGVVDWLARWAG